MRPRKCRRVNFEYSERQFKPYEYEKEIPEDAGPAPEDAGFAPEDVRLAIDELEAMRLSFLEGLSQSEAAARMEIHQSTFQRALKKALEKITEALVNGKAIRIEGGDYKMPGRDGTGPGGKGPVYGGRGDSRGGRGNGPGGGKGGRFGGPDGNCVCPACGYETPHKPGVPCSQMKCEKCGTPMVRK